MSLPTRPRRGAAALDSALVLAVFTVWSASAIDLAWLAVQRSSLASAVALGCRAVTADAPGRGEPGTPALEATAKGEILDALAAAGAPCDRDCIASVTTFATDAGRSLGCTVSRDFQPLTRLVVQPMRIESTSVVPLPGTLWSQP